MSPGMFLVNLTAVIIAGAVVLLLISDVDSLWQDDPEEDTDADDRSHQ